MTPDDPKLANLVLVRKTDLWKHPDYEVWTFKFPDLTLPCDCRLYAHVVMAKGVTESEPDGLDYVHELARQGGVQIASQPHTCWVDPND